MVHDKFSEVIDSVHAALFSKKKLRQNLIFHLMDVLTENERSPKETPDAETYQAIQDRLEEVWQYREWESMTAEQAFLYGQLYGCVKFCSYEEKANQDQKWMNVLVSKYKKERRGLFQAISDTPGIRHKELSEKTGYKISYLSQIMNEKSMQELVECCFSGREKYYFLRPQGKLLLSKMEEQDRKEWLGHWQSPSHASKAELVRIPENSNNEYVLVSGKSNMRAEIFDVKSRMVAEYIKEFININYNEVIVEDNLAGGRSKCRAVENNYQEMPTNRSLIGSMMS